MPKAVATMPRYCIWIWGEWVGSYIICGSLNQTYSSSSTIYILYIPRPTHTIYAYMVYLWVGGILRANTNTTTTRQHREMGWEMRIVDGSWVCVVGGGKRARQLHLTPVHLINWSTDHLIHSIPIINSIYTYLRHYRHTPKIIKVARAHLCNYSRFFSGGAPLSVYDNGRK